MTCVGDHFFVYHNDALDEAVVTEISNCILRKINQGGFFDPSGQHDTRLANVDTSAMEDHVGTLEFDPTTTPTSTSSSVASSISVPSSFHDLIPLVKDLIHSVISSAPEDDENVDLRNYGLDSITGTELANDLADTLQIELLPAQLVDNYTEKKIIQLVMHQLKVVEKIIADAATNQAVGALCNGNPWFANYYADNPKAHLVIFGGMAHPVVTWHKFVQMYLKYGINVHIVRLPGRFERLMEEAERDVKVLVDGVIKVSAHNPMYIT